VGAIWETKVGCRGGGAKEGRNGLGRPDDAGWYTGQLLYWTFFHRLSSWGVTAGI
jgi:hypothetical protein